MSGFFIRSTRVLKHFLQRGASCGRVFLSLPLPVSLFFSLTVPVHQSRAAAAAAAAASPQRWRAGRSAAAAAAPPLTRSGGCWMYHEVSAALGGSVPPPHRLLPALRGRPTR